MTSNTRGVKVAALSCDGKPLKLTRKGVTTPFSVGGSDGKSDRKRLDLRADQDLQPFVKELPSN